MGSASSTQRKIPIVLKVSKKTRNEEKIEEVEKVNPPQQEIKAPTCVSTCKEEKKISKSCDEKPLNPMMIKYAPSLPSREEESEVTESDATNKENKNTSDSVDDFNFSTMDHEQFKHVRSSNFNVWKCETSQLITYVTFMFHDLGIVRELGITNARLRRWLMAVEKNYGNVHFHNFRHAFCVTQMMYVIIFKLKLKQQMTTLQLGVLLVACVCHDLDHPGLSNVYQKKACTELSILYDNKSPLEHHHCAVAFKLLAVEDLNIFVNVEANKLAEMSHIIIQLILATDMAIHAKIVSDFQSNVNEGFDLSNPKHMLALLKILIKCCDISNEVRPLNLSDRWVDRLFEEFFAQANRERREGLQVAVYMDIDKVKKARDQLKFIRNIMLPLFECVGEVFPDMNRDILKSLKESECYYERMSNVEKCNLKLNENDQEEVADAELEKSEGDGDDKSNEPNL